MEDQGNPNAGFTLAPQHIREILDRSERIRILENSVERVLNTALRALANSRPLTLEPDQWEELDTAGDDLADLSPLIIKLWDHTRNELYKEMFFPQDAP